MIEKLLIDILKENPVECPICLMPIEQDPIGQTCACKQLYHKGCLKQCDNGVCQMCDQRVKSVNTALTVIRSVANIQVIRDKIEYYCHYNFDLARELDLMFATKLNYQHYIELIGGVYRLPSTCLFRYSNTRPRTSLFKENDNVIVGLDQFKFRFGEFTFGLLNDILGKDESNETNVIVSGLTVPCLLTTLTANEQPVINVVDLITYAPSYQQLFQRLDKFISQIRAKIGDLVKINLYQSKNYVSIQFNGLPLRLNIETIISRTISLYTILNQYSCSHIDLCQAYYDGINIALTIKALNSLKHQTTTDIKRDIELSLYKYLNNYGYHINVSKNKIIDTEEEELTEQHNLDYQSLMQYLQPELIFWVKNNVSLNLFNQLNNMASNVAGQLPNIRVTVKRHKKTRGIILYMGDRQLKYPHIYKEVNAIVSFVKQSDMYIQNG